MGNFWDIINWEVQFSLNTSVDALHGVASIQAQSHWLG